MTWLDGLIIIQAFAVLLACGSVLTIAITVLRSTGSIESRITRIDSLLDQIERRAETKKVSL
jgi:hypothetical protein